MEVQPIPTETPRLISLPKSSKLTEEVVEKLNHIFEFASPEEYRNTLIEIYHSYVYHEHESLPINFKEMAGQMSVLIDFLLVAGRE